MILVTSRKGPDLDGFANSFAYAEFLEQTYSIYGQEMADARAAIELLDIEPKRDLKESFEGFILVDVSSPRNLPEIVEAEKVLEVIDHRKVDLSKVKEWFPKAELQIELVGACATLIAEKFFKEGKKPSNVAAQLLHAAILSNTLMLKAGVTSRRDIEAVKKLEKLGASSELSRKILLRRQELMLMNLQEEMEKDFNIYMLGNKRLGIAQLEFIDAKEVLERLDKILEFLEFLRKKRKADLIFLNLVDIERGRSYIVTPQEQVLGLFKRGVKKSNNLLELPLMLRKEIVPEIGASYT